MLFRMEYDVISSFFVKYFFFSYLSVYMCSHVNFCPSHVCAGAWGDQMALDSLELELYAVVCHLMWMMGVGTESSTRATKYVLNP